MHNHHSASAASSRSLGYLKYAAAAAALSFITILLYLALNQTALVNVLNSLKLSQQEQNAYFIAVVVDIADKSTDAEADPNSVGVEGTFLRVEGKTGSYDGREVEVFVSAADANFFGGGEGINLVEGDDVIVLSNSEGPEEIFSLVERYRLSAVIFAVILFFGIAALFAGLKGITALAGLLVSFGVLVVFVVPQILSGGDPVVTSLIGAVLIAFSSLYLAHGFSLRSTLALGSTLISIFISVVLAVVFVELTRIFGFGTEEALYVKAGEFGDVNLKGLLLGGMIIGTLGVLDDVTTAQTATVEEIYNANQKLGFGELYRRGLSVGREHITSLVNTLVLAYAGASFPLFLLIVGAIGEPLWVTLNSEFIVEEIIRTIVGSATLIAAVPLATAISAYYFSRQTRN